MVSENSRLVLNYNGEIYNYRALRSELEGAASAPAWRGHSDTEALLAGFQAWGVGPTLQRCNGMFALALWDRQERVLTLARDRMGEKPLYLGWIDGQFVFASELKALVQLPGWSARMHAGAISSFLGTGYVSGPQSAVSGIFRLPPGSLLTLGLEQLQRVHGWEELCPHIARYWSLTSVAIAGQRTPMATAVDAVHETEALLRDSVRLRMEAEVPLGAFLSGGIDSSLITALMQTQSSQRIRTFSIGFEDPAFNEARYARAVANHLGTEHTELYVNAGDALAAVPRLAATFDEPFADHSQIPAMLLAELVRRHVTVALSGDGGDELFAGYGRYFAIVKLWRVLRFFPATARMHIAPMLVASAEAMRPLANIFRADSDWPQRLERLGERLIASDVDALRLSFIGSSGVTRLQTTTNWRAPEHCLPPRRMHDVLRRLMYGDQLDYLPDDILHKVDRASMAYGLEARVPLLDHRVVELSWRLPPSLLRNSRAGKLMLRTILARHVPDTLINRPKQGFSPPLGSWLRGPLREWAETLLARESLRELPILDERGIRSLWTAHLNEQTDASNALWNVLMLCDWRKRFSIGL